MQRISLLFTFIFIFILSYAQNGSSVQDQSVAKNFYFDNVVDAGLQGKMKSSLQNGPVVEFRIHNYVGYVTVVIEVRCIWNKANASVDVDKVYVTAVESNGHVRYLTNYEIGELEDWLWQNCFKYNEHKAYNYVVTCTLGSQNQHQMNLYKVGIKLRQNAVRDRSYHGIDMNIWIGYVNSQYYYKFEQRKQLDEDPSGFEGRYSQMKKVNRTTGEWTEASNQEINQLLNKLDTATFQYDRETGVTNIQ